MKENNMDFFKNNSNVLIVLLNFFGMAGALYATTGEQPESIAPLSFNTSATRKVVTYKPIKCLMSCVKSNDDLERLANVIKFDLAFTDQIVVEFKNKKTAFEDEALKKMFDNDISLYLSLEQETEKEVRITLKDTSSGANVFQKTYSSGKHHVFLGHSMSNDLIPLLTGHPSITMSTLAYCKQLSSHQKIICISDYAGMIEVPVITTKTLNVAPSWHSKSPYLFYSQFMPTKSSLMSYNLRSNKNFTVCSYDGLNMQPSFSKDGMEIALCLSAEGKNSEIFLYDQKLCNRIGKRTFRQLTSNGGSNSSPRLLANGDVVFCSDFETRSPQLYYLKRSDTSITRLSDGRSYCAAPVVNEKNGLIAYTRYINGAFQLFTMDLNGSKNGQEQRTFDSSDKLDPAWSSCGRYIFFTLDTIDKKTGKKNAQIASFNCLSKKVRIITKDMYHKSFSALTDQSYYQIGRGQALSA